MSIRRKLCEHGAERDYCVHCLKARIRYLEEKLNEIGRIKVDAFWYFKGEEE